MLHEIECRYCRHDVTQDGSGAIDMKEMDSAFRMLGESRHALNRSIMRRPSGALKPLLILPRSMHTIRHEPEQEGDRTADSRGGPGQDGWD